MRSQVFMSLSLLVLGALILLAVAHVFDGSEETESPRESSVSVQPGHAAAD